MENTRRPLPYCSLGLLAFGSVLSLACGSASEQRGSGEEGADGSRGCTRAECNDSGIVTAGQDGSAGTAEAEGSGDGASAEDEAGRLDVIDTGGDPCDGGPGGGGVAFSYIWIANSEEGTVSKIDTRTGTELGRYVSGPEAITQPSRTSVNLLGDMVVANRGGGYMGTEANGGSITKIAAELERCVDTNGNGTIDTSDGPNNVLAWGEDECVLWNTPVESERYTSGPRPLSWEGRGESDLCGQNPRVWTGFYVFDENKAIFRRLDGNTGVVEDEVVVEDFSSLDEPHVLGPYGGAVDGDGDFWITGFRDGPLLRIHGDTLAVDRYELDTGPRDRRFAYGIALDREGRPWLANGTSLARFDPATETWAFVQTNNDSLTDWRTVFRGVMVDEESRAWVALNDPRDYGGTRRVGLAVIDTDTMTVTEDYVPIAGAEAPVGVSIDADGFVWIVDRDAEVAFKIDPDNYNVDLTVTGLSVPYTYSDMTGVGLSLVNPAG